MARRSVNRQAVREATRALYAGDLVRARRIAEAHLDRHGPDPELEALLDDIVLAEESARTPEDRSPFPTAAAGWTPEQFSPSFTPEDPAAPVEPRARARNRDTED